MMIGAGAAGPMQYHLNGKLIPSETAHSPYNSVTFDPFNHAAGYVPLHAILSGCCGKSVMLRRETGFFSALYGRNRPLVLFWHGPCAK
jgi:hypothetical protein